MLLTMHAFEVGEVRRESGDWVLDVDILPNRMSDASSHVGIARELAAILKVRDRTLRRTSSLLMPPTFQLSENRRRPVSQLLRVRIEDREGCSFYAGRVIEGISVKPSPPWLQRRLRAVGVEPISNVVDATNYVMLELGQPLHAFDLAKIHAEPRRGSRRSTMPKEIIVRRAKKGEKIVTLDGEERTLDPSVTVIADSLRPLAIAGIKGGDVAAITEETTAIAIESAHFDPKCIYRASRKLSLATDASKRFEAGRSPESTLLALDRVAALIVSLAGGSLAKGVVTAGRLPFGDRAIPFSPERAATMLGMSIEWKDAERALEAIGCTIVVPRKPGIWAVTPPHDRLDLECEEDLIEEVGRLLGYENISRELPHAVLIPPAVPPRHLWADRARDILVAHGLNETMRSSFVNEAMLRDWGFDLDDRELVDLLNPQSADATILRSTLLPRLFTQAQESRRREEHVGLFEIGKVFARERATDVSERMKLAMVIAEADPLRFVSARQDRTPFYEAKGILADLCERFGLADVSWEPLTQEGGPWHPGKTAALVVDGERIGIVGELLPRIVEAHPPLGVVAASEIDLDHLADVASSEHEYREPSKFPEVIRDLAVLVPRDVLVDEVEQEIALAGKELVRDIDLFDYYEGEAIPEGMKNLAFRIIYQAYDRTLTAKEVDAVHREIERLLRARGWHVR